MRTRSIAPHGHRRSPIRRAALTAVAVLGALSTGVLPAARAAAPTVSAELLSTTKTSEWRSPSPDPTGLTLIRSTNRLIVSDAEVEEIPRLWKGGNLFTASRRGALIRRGSVLRATPEPEDVAWHGGSRSLYVVDDDRDRVYRIRAGDDGRVGTTDDRSRAILRTRSFGSRDPEGLAWRSRGRTLIVTDARRGRVFTVRSGRDRRFGTLDDVTNTFATSRLGLTIPEDVEFDPRSRHLFIVSSAEDVVAETTMRGRLIRTIDLSAAKVHRAAGIALTPSPTDPGVMHMFIVAKGTDNESDPMENDGKLFRFSFPT
jgi:sugar lactone lactonase YvrE